MRILIELSIEITFSISLLFQVIVIWYYARKIKK